MPHPPGAILRTRNHYNRPTGRLARRPNEIFRVHAGGSREGPKYSELLLVAVLAADYSPLAAVHIKGARTAGASEHEIAEAIVCTVTTSGLSAWVSGAAAMDAP